MMFDKTLWTQFKTNKYERRGILIFLVFIIGLSVALHYLVNYEPIIQETDPALTKVLQEYYLNQEAPPKPKKIVYKNDDQKSPITNKRKKLTHILKSKIVLDYFDPNLANHQRLMTLGFSERQANTIINFRSKGFGFKKPEDLLKIYNIDSAHVYKLIPYMLFPEPESTVDHSPEATTSSTKQTALTPKSYAVLNKPKMEKIEINTATEESLQTIYGIGPAFSNIIINYRDRLGGYNELAQLAEPYDFPDSTLTFLHEALTIDTSSLKKINVNEATFKELLQHPYLSYEDTKILYPFIENRRPISSIGQLDKMLAFDKVTLKKLKPYLTTKVKVMATH